MERRFMRRLSLLIFVALVVFGSIGVDVFAAQVKEEQDIQTQELVGTIVSVNQEALSFDVEYTLDDPSHDKKVSTFFVTDITTIDIAMSQANLNDLKPGFNVLVEYAPMPDGTKIVESVWVKKT